MFCNYVNVQCVWMKTQTCTSSNPEQYYVIQREGRVHAGNTTYTADSHPNSTNPRQENMNVNGYKNTEDTQKQTRARI